MVAIAILGLILADPIELSRRRGRYLRAYREHALLEYEAAIKARIVAINGGHKGAFFPSVAEIEEMHRLDPEGRRLFEADDEDLRAMLAEAGWTKGKKIPVVIDRNEAIDRDKLGLLVRREDYHRTLRKKYRRAARFPWRNVDPDPPRPVGAGDR